METIPEQIGDYFDPSIIEKDHPQIIDEWFDWLEKQKDAGYYNAYKTIHGEWKTEVYMPQF